MRRGEHWLGLRQTSALALTGPLPLTGACFGRRREERERDQSAAVERDCLVAVKWSQGGTRFLRDAGEDARAPLGAPWASSG